MHFASPSKLRSDGAHTRTRLLDAALALFAEKGFAKTSTREIAEAAQVNIASISYYFGDKAGLYRAVWLDPRINAPHQLTDAKGEPLGLLDALDGLLRSFIEPIKQGHLAKQCMKLHLREMLEPTGIWQEEIDTHIKPAHMAMAQAICRYIHIAEPDDDIHRLTFAIAGLGITLHVSGDVFATIRPQLVDTHEALDLYHARLMDYALALIEQERQRRLPVPASPEGDTVARNPSLWSRWGACGKNSKPS